MGLTAALADSKQRLLAGANTLPLDQLATLKDSTIGVMAVEFAAQQPLEIVSVRRPTEISNGGSGNRTQDMFRAKYKDVGFRSRTSFVESTNYLFGDVLLPHNIATNGAGNKTLWDQVETAMCASAVDRRISDYVNNHLYMESTLQPAYTAAAFFLFQNGVVRDILPQDTTALALDGNIQETSWWFSVPKLSAVLTLAGCGLLVVAAAVALVRLHRQAATQGHKVLITTPHQIARVMVDDTTFPSLLLKRRVRDNHATSDADQFVIQELTLRSVNETNSGGGQAKQAP